MQGTGGEVVQRDLALAAQLAAVFVRPLDVFDEHAGRLEPFTATETRTIASHPAFRAPLNRALTKAMGLSDVAIGREQLDRLRTDHALRCAVLLVSQSMDLVRQAAEIVGAAVLHKRALKLTLKAELARIREILGPTGFEIATHEAPLLHGALAELDAAADPKIFDPAASAAEGRKHLIDFGLQILCGFVGRAAPALAELMTHRCQSDIDRQARGHAPGPLGALHCDHIVRLIRRRLPPWSAIIG
jgi:hypothetical protein